ncbi:MAG: 3-methylornithyl-N6-L-lysine dehydrogenase PylD [Eubacteriaceae bacterium]|nr:3-methylornithyl-N6-L-lysine dehydrogenase PylD [Eubacteriaceae bacterium]
MTRLKTVWIKNIETNTGNWAASFEEITGSSIYSTAAAAAGISEAALRKYANTKKVAVVPFTCGEGVIETFADSLRAISEEMGFDSVVTEHNDVSGIYEASCRGNDIILLADDDRYIALNTSNGKIGENDEATAAGYIEALDAMNKKRSGRGISGETVLILGYGRVGREMKDYLLKKGSKVVIYDNDPVKQKMIEDDDMETIRSESEIKQFDLIADATSTGPWITEDMMDDDVLIVSPGVPFSLDSRAMEKFKGQYLHDDLETGTAVMLAMAAE